MDKEATDILNDCQNAQSNADIKKIIMSAPTAKIALQVMVETGKKAQKCAYQELIAVVTAARLAQAENADLKKYLNKRDRGHYTPEKLAWAANISDKKLAEYAQLCLNGDDTFHKIYAREVHDALYDDEVKRITQVAAQSARAKLLDPSIGECIIADEIQKANPTERILEKSYQYIVDAISKTVKRLGAVPIETVRTGYYMPKINPQHVPVSASYSVYNEIKASNRTKKIFNAYPTRPSRHIQLIDGEISEEDKYWMMHHFAGDIDVTYEDDYTKQVVKDYFTV